MKYFAESNHLLDDPPTLRRRLRDDGYLFLRDILPKDEVLDLRRSILEFCQEVGWLLDESNLMDGLTDHPPVLEGQEEWRPVYAKVQSLEAFHRLKLHYRVHKVMEDIFQEPVFALPMTIARIVFPRDNERGTQPHQDWLYVGGSTEIISCWAPLGDVPVEVGGLKLLAGSHKAGFLVPRPAPGPGGNIVAVDSNLDWLQTDYLTGDLLLFKSLTVHAAANNHTPDVLRLSVDFRYAGESHVITEGWLQPHFNWLGEPFSWDKLDTDWRDSPTARYWEKLPDLKIKPHERFGRG
ncbi:TPA: hypothetical protein EYO77_10280 [Candidatus Poribacteria bacterium]|nr:hypothetical protein [Candidatus Poribacteria bacterium]